MKKLIASLGLFLLVAQVTLGNAGALFLCLCADHDDGANPCAPAFDEASVGSCQHDLQTVEPLAQVQEDECEDLLFAVQDIDAVEQSNQPLKTKATLCEITRGPAQQLQKLLEPVEQQQAFARAENQSPASVQHYTRTTKLLL